MSEWCKCNGDECTGKSAVMRCRMHSQNALWRTQARKEGFHQYEELVEAHKDEIANHKKSVNAIYDNAIENLKHSKEVNTY